MSAPAQPIRTVGLVISQHRRRAEQAAAPLAGELRRVGVRVLVGEEGARASGLQAEVVPESEVVRSDLVIVLGGDGTLLHTAGRAAPFGVPVLGVDLGSFGFLAGTELEELYRHLDQIIAGDFQVEERLMIRATLERGGEAIDSWTGLNDAVIGVCSYTHLVRLGIALDGEEVATYSTDGLVISTPTGSTGYSLSAGGPVVDPLVDSLVITPICPHTLQARPVVVAASASISVGVEHTTKDARDIVLTVDGDLVAHLESDDRVVVRRAEFGAKLVRLGGSTFYGRLRDKLNWGKSH